MGITVMQLENICEYRVAHARATQEQLLSALKNEAHVCLAFADRHSDPKLLAWYWELVSEEEREKYKSFHFARDRDLYLLTHGLLRASLSRYMKMAPDKWVFTHNRYGCPEIAQPDGNPQLRFSLSRTHGLVACLIVLPIDAGVDVEQIRRMDNLKNLSEKVFTELEISMLHNLPESEQTEGFFTLWTLKEAYIKARGQGLSLPLNRFGFYFDAAGHPRISFDVELRDIPSNWQFATFRPTRSHAIALPLRRKDSADLRIRFIEAIPEPNDISFKQWNSGILISREEYYVFGDGKNRGKGEGNGSTLGNHVCRIQ